MLYKHLSSAFPSVLTRVTRQSKHRGRDLNHWPAAYTRVLRQWADENTETQQEQQSNSYIQTAILFIFYI